jgi:hypothetical protein
MRRHTSRISDLYQDDIERHLFAPETRQRRRFRSSRWLASWLPLVIVVIVRLVERL